MSANAPYCPIPRVRHEDVRRPELGFELCHRAGQRLRVGDIGHRDRASAAARREHRAEVGLVSRDQADGGPLDAAAASDGCPDARDAPVITAVAPAHCTRADGSRQTCRERRSHGECVAGRSAVPVAPAVDQVREPGQEEHGPQDEKPDHDGDEHVTRLRPAGAPRSPHRLGLGSLACQERVGRRA